MLKTIDGYTWCQTRERKKKVVFVFYKKAKTGRATKLEGVPAVVEKHARSVLLHSRILSFSNFILVLGQCNNKQRSSNNHPLPPSPAL